jgi:dolichyl-phosphate beta-glucosyltransferase
LLYIAEYFNIKVYEVDVNWEEKDGSKVTMASWVQMGKDLLSIRLHYLFGAWKLNPHFRVAD